MKNFKDYYSNNKRNKLYTLMYVACLSGYVWLFYNYYKEEPSNQDLGVCFIKNITGYPCPSCGSTRSALSILHGDFLGAFYINPLGYIISFIMLIVPLWIMYDVLRKRNSLLVAYTSTENLLKKPWISITFITLILFNWIWNIIKEL